MASIDERIVSMAFENAKFEAGVAQTMATLAKLNDQLSKIGTTTGFAEIDKAANKVTLEGPVSALDKLKAKIFGVGTGSPEAFAEIDKAGNKVTLEGPITAMDKVNAKIATVGTGAPEAFGQIEKASSRVSLEGIITAIDNVAAKFSVLQTAAGVALGGIAAQAAQHGASVVKSLSLGPLTDGFKEYTTNLNSIQTILANTKASGADLQDVNKALQELNEYSDQTIYNFSQMADAIGLFTAAGVDLKTSVSSIKGLANLAALSGSSNEKATHAMQQLSQAVAAGKVTMQDWISVRNAGMGGTVFQRALAQTAEAMGTIKKGAVDLEGPMKNVKISGESFADSIRSKPGEQSWLTSKVLTETLKQFTGDMSDAELAAQGFSAAQIKAIQDQAKTAKNAATEVKNLKQVFDVAKEAIGTGWSDTFQIIFGNFTEAKKTFTELSQAIGAVVGKAADARNAVLEDWKKLGGRTDLIEAIKNIFEAIASFIKPLKDAFQQIFPPATGRDLAELTKNFRDFTETLKLSPATMEALKRTFAGFFAVLHIGWTIVKQVFRVIGDLLGVVGQGSGGFLNFTGSIGDFLVALDKALTKGGALTGLFDGLASVIKVPLELLGLLSSALFNLFSGGGEDGSEKFGKGLAKIAEEAGPLKRVLDVLTTAWEKFTSVLEKVRDAVSPWLGQVAEAFSDFGSMVKDAFNNINWDQAFGAIETGLIAGLFLTIKKAIKGGIGIDVGGGLLENLNKTFEALTGNLKAMQQNVQAGTLLKIAAAIGVLAAAVLVLSQIDPVALNRAMTAVAIGLGELVGALALLSKVAKGGAFLTLPVLATGLIALSVAVLILAGALKVFATMDWDEMAKGLVGVGGSLAVVGAAARLIGPGIIPAALGLIPLAIALNILALAVKQFGSLKMEELAKGIGGIGVALGLIAAAMAFMPPSMPLIGLGLIAVGIGLNAVAAAVAAFGNMELKTMVQGLLGIAGAIVAIGMAVALIPPTLALQAAGLVILSVALTGIATSIALMGKLKLTTLVKGIGALAAALVVLGIGLTGMAGTLPGSIALLAAASALAILAPTLALLGNLEWSTIFKGLGAIALALGTLAVVGLLAAPALVALGAAMLPLGLGMAAVAAAAYLFAKALSLVGADGTKAVATVIAALTALAIAIPKIIMSFLQGIVDMAGQVAEIAPKVLMALGVMIDMIIAFVIESAPKLAEAIGVLVQQFAKVVFENLPTLVATGFQMLLTFLSGVANNIGQVVQEAAKVITAFLKEFATQAPNLVRGGLTVLINFLRGITANLPRLVKTVFDMVTKFIEELTKNLPRVIAAGVKFIVALLNGIASKIKDVIKAGKNLVIKFMDGIGEAIPDLVKAGLRLARKFLNGLADGLSGLADIGFKAVIRFLNGLERAIRENFDDLVDAGIGIADAIIDGVTSQFGKLAWPLKKAVEAAFSLLPDWAKKILRIQSPSKVFAEIGMYTMMGFIEGMKDGGEEAAQNVGQIAQKVVDNAEDALKPVPSMLANMIDLDPTITPVLDLTQVERDAKKLGDITAETPLVPTVSSDTASAVATETSQSQADAAAAETTKIELNQYNESPKALDEIEIYRQTKNQLSQVKSALGVA